MEILLYIYRNTSSCFVSQEHNEIFNCKTWNDIYIMIFHGTPEVQIISTSLIKKKRQTVS